MIDSPPIASSEGFVSDLIERFRPGWSLPQPFYNDPRVFERDMDRIFMRDWLFVDHASRIPRPGDYFLFEIGGESIIVCRARDGSINAMFNVCRHRGSRVCLEPSGSAQALVCPYHAWSYRLDGRLLSARAMAPDTDTASLGLRRCAVRLVEDLIFISLSAQPPLHEEAFRTWERYLRPHGLKNAKVGARLTWRLKANWKVMVENFLECYHCGPAHPEYCAVMVQAVTGTGRARDTEIYQAFLAEWSERAKAAGTYLPWTDVAGDIHCMCTRLGIRQGYVTQSRDGRPVAPLMGDFKDFDGGLTVGELGKVNFFIAANDYCLVPRFTPLTHDTCEMEMLYLVEGEAVEGVDYRVDDLVWLWKVTTDQDKRIIEDTQLGVNSRTYEPGPFSETEKSLRRFADGYIRAIS